MLNEPTPSAGGSLGQGGLSALSGGGQGASPPSITVTPQEKQAIERVCKFFNEPNHRFRNLLHSIQQYVYIQYVFNFG